MVIQRLLHLVSMTVVRLYTWLMLRLDVFWQAPFPVGPKLIVANHPSATDPFYLGLLSSQPISLLIIESLFLIPILGAFLRWSGHIPVVPIIPIGIYLPRERNRAIASTVAGKRMTGYLYLRGKYGVTVGQAMHFKGDVEDRGRVAAVSEDIMQQIVSLAQQSERRVKAALGGI